MKKIKLKKPIIIGIIGLLVVGLIIFFILNRRVSAGKVVNGRVKYSEKIRTASESSTKVIEINSINQDKLDTVIITSEKLKAIKNKDKLYSMKLKDYLKIDGVSNRDIYNVQKAIELKIVKEDDTLIKFLYKVTGFKSQKQFVKFCEDAFELMEK